MKKKHLVILYVISFLLCFVFMGIILYAKGFYFGCGWDKYRIYKTFCDATFVPGLFVFCFGILMAISNEGLFTAVGYSLMRFTASLGKDYQEKRKNMLSYAEYRALKTSKNSPSAFAWIPGLVFMAASVVFLILYYS